MRNPLVVEEDAVGANTASQNAVQLHESARLVSDVRDDVVLA